jgi:hypothetical protein
MIDKSKGKIQVISQHIPAKDFVPMIVIEFTDKVMNCQND